MKCVLYVADWLYIIFFRDYFLYCKFYALVIYCTFFVNDINDPQLTYNLKEDNTVSCDDVY